MKFILKYVSCLVCAFAAYAEKHSELIVNFPFDDAIWNERLANQGYSGKLIKKADLSHFGKGLKRKHKNRPLALDSDLDKIIFWNLSDHDQKYYDLSRIPKEKLILLMWEPPTVISGMSSPEAHQLFSRVYTWDDDLIDNQHIFKLYYPALAPMISAVVPFEQKKLCTLIASNFSSDFPKELYTERKNAIAFFERIKEPGFEFYGKGWNAEEHPAYRGAIPDKIAILKHYRFSICYENTRDIRGYITEKIFDCFCAGNVPVYWGASNVTDYIPKDCFIDRRDYKSLEDLYQFLKAMPKQDYEAYLSRIRTFLSSPKAQRFSHLEFEKLLGNAIKGD